MLHRPAALAPPLHFLFHPCGKPIPAAWMDFVFWNPSPPRIDLIGPASVPSWPGACGPLNCPDGTFPLEYVLKKGHKHWLGKAAEARSIAGLVIYTSHGRRTLSPWPGCSDSAKRIPTGR